MNVDAVRRFCLAFTGAKENLQWGETLCFKIDGKIFATLSLDSVPPSICFKCALDKFEELLEQEGIKPAPYVGRYKWVLVESLDVLRDAELEELLGESFHMVSAKVPARKRPSTKKKRKKVR